MKKSISKLLVLSWIFASTSCSLPRMVSVTTQYAPTNTVMIIQTGQPLPNGCIRMGSITVGDDFWTKGMIYSSDCTYEVCMQATKEEAQKVGADIIYIVQIVPPYSGEDGSTCYRIIADLYKFQ